MRRLIAAAAGALCASLAAAQSEEPRTPGRGGLPGVTGTAVDARPQPPAPDRNAPSPEGQDATGRSGPSEPGSAGGRSPRRGESREVDQGTIAEVHAALERGLPRERLQRLRVYNRDGRAYVGGTVRSEAEKDALRRVLFQLVSPEQVVLDVEVRPEGGP